MRQRESSAHWSRLLVLTLSLALFLSACGNGSASNSQNKTPSKVVTPTAAPVSALDMTTYKSKFFSISYPKDWQKVAVGDNVTFTSSQTGYLAIEAIPNPDALTSVSTGVLGSVKGLQSTFPNHFSKATIPDSTTINGIKWSQSGLTGSAVTKGATHTIKAIVLGTNHPDRAPGTKLFLVIYTADTSVFDQLVAAAFEPMLASLKLTN
ncbi:MAG TPA: hypothetical protein VL485_03800 [Ktedonobacteraceae bacterium]|nr:hypothetical protein [Ktedonobacteraceae bacterium]